MAGTNYKIDPVRATCKKYENKIPGIQGINDTCFGICASYSGTLDTYQMDPKCTQSCIDLVEQRKRAIYGIGSCDHQAPYRPVFWGQTPRYVPNLLKKGLSPEQALSKCKDLCNTFVKNLNQECIDNCIVDYDAIEQYDNKRQVAEPQKKEEKKKINPVLIVVPILILLIILFFLVKSKI